MHNGRFTLHEILSMLWKSI